MTLSSKAALNKEIRNCGSELQRRHYATIAGIIRNLHEDVREKVALHFADELRGTNPQYSRSRFLAACKVS